MTDRQPVSPVGDQQAVTRLIYRHYLNDYKVDNDNELYSLNWVITLLVHNG